MRSPRVAPRSRLPRFRLARGGIRSRLYLLKEVPISLSRVFPPLLLIASLVLCAAPSPAAISTGVFLDGALDSQITGMFGATR